MAIVFLTTAIVAIMATFYLYRKIWCHRYFKRLGIPGPEPHFLFGNMHKLWTYDSHLVIHEWAKKYGEAFGYYEGSRPILVFSSIAGAESICIKQYPIFTGRMASLIQPDSEKEPDHPLLNLLLAKGDRWHKPRMVANRFFSAPKMRTMLPIFEKRMPYLFDIIERANRKPLDVGEPFQRFAMDSLAEAGFGLRMDLLEPVDKESGKLPKNPVFERALEMMSTFLHTTPFVFKVVSVLPEVISVMKFVIHLVMKYSAGPLSPFLCLFTMMAKAVEHRRAQKQQTQTNGYLGNSHLKTFDLLKLFMDVTKFDEEKQEGDKKASGKESTDHLNGGIVENGDSNQGSSGERFMSEQELKAQLVTLFLSGYETTSVSLMFLSAVLARNQDVQAKLVNEIAKTFPNQDDPIDYDVLVNMEYLECVCKELLRLYPVATNAVNRLVHDDVTVCGYPVTKKIAKVLVNVWSIHMDPEQWGEEPERFWPERFLPDNKPMNQSRSAFLGFGLGPHQCVGKMFSQVEIKYVIIKLLRRYKITCPSNDESTNVPVKVAIVMTPRDPVKLIFTPRKSDCEN